MRLPFEARARDHVRLRRLLLTASLAGPLMIAHAFAQTVYVKRADVDLRSSSARTGSVVQTLPQGEALEVLAQEGVYYRVRTRSGATGYVSRLHVSDTAPRTGSRTGFGIQNTTGPSERANVSSIRGLNPVAEEYAGAEEIPAQAVEDAKKIEQLAATVTDQQVDAFLNEGGVESP